MLIERPERLAENLENGLGEIHWLLKGLYPNLRLRTDGVCGVSSIALNEHLEAQGYDTEMVISEPKLDVEPGMRHVMNIVYVDGSEYLIDTSYSQHLSYAGQTPGYVMFGGRNVFPESKIEVISNGQSEMLVEKMTHRALEALDIYEPIEDLGPRVPEFMILDEDEIRATYAAIWDPAYFDQYRPTDATLNAGKKLSTFILDENVRLIA